MTRNAEVERIINLEELEKSTFIQEEQVRLLYGNSIPSAIGIIIIALAFWKGFQGIIEPQILILWPTIMISIACARLLLTQQFNNNFNSEEVADIWARKFTTNTILAGIGWGVLCILLLSVNEVVHQTAIIMIILGVMGVSVPLLSTYIPAFLASSLPSVIILPLMIYSQMHETAPVLTPAIILFIVLIYFITFKSNSSLTKAIALEFEKNMLLGQIQMEVIERKKAQDNLEYNQLHLEMLVEQRTTQLANRNSDLRLEIEERKQIEQALNESERRFRTAGKVAYDLIYEWNVKDRSIEWFGDVDKILGYQAGEISDDNNAWTWLIHPEDIKNYTETVELFEKATRKIHRQYRVRHNSGSFRYWSNHAIPLFDDNNMPYKWIGVCTDITEQKEHQQQLEHVAHYDILTNLPNRVLLGGHLREAMHKTRQEGNALAVAYLDLDGFKEVNDAHGHEIGDRLLVSLSKRLDNVLREGDMIARIGGDEFVVILLNVDKEQEELPMLNRLLHATSQPIHISDLVLQVSGSLGVTYYPQTEKVNSDQLLRQADQAMYQAKLSGKNRFYVFDTEQDRTLRGKHENLEHIYHALSNNEFVLHYQPKVNMRTGELVGAEALIRWEHTELGLQPPSFFLPLIEDLPFAAELGEWVIDTALSQHESWLAEGLNIPISVNIGPYQLQQPQFIERLELILKSHPKVAANQLELEVLESSALEDMYQISEVMQKCKKLGVSFALDDFGTGYSTLSYLKYLPANILKIDQSFVRDMLEDPEDLAILEGILGMSMAFRRKVIAEGVETVEHGELLLKLGCELAQGFGISRPIPGNTLPEWVSNWKPFPSWKNQPPVNRDNLSIIFAAVEHRSWIRMLNEYILGQRDNPPPLKDTECRLGQWIHGDGAEKYGNNKSFKDLVTIHHDVHKTGSMALQLQSEGKHDEAVKTLDVIFKQRDTLLNHLNDLF